MPNRRRIWKAVPQKGLGPPPARPRWRRKSVLGV